jgi:cobalt-precorrin 5A hydrolase
MIVAGVGCRKGARAADITAAIAAAFVRAGLVPAELMAGLSATDARHFVAPRNDAVDRRILMSAGLALIATSAAKGGEPGIAVAAWAIGVPLILVPQGDLEAAGDRGATRSERVVALFGVPSVAEAAALAAGGRSARLITPRIAVGPATCALADTGESP